MACLQEITNSLKTTKLDESNSVSDNDDLWKFLFLNIVPVFQKSLPCPENDIGCIFRAKDAKPRASVVVTEVNRKEDTDAFATPFNPINSNSPVLHQAVASAVSNGAIVSDSYMLV